MTDPSPARILHLSSTAVGPDVLRITVRGELDVDSAAEFQDAVTEHLAAHTGLRALRVDCGGLVLRDCMGLSALLMVHRRTTALGVSLHLEERPPALDRLLAVTGTLDHLTAPPAAAASTPPSS
ncbi:STAS domain-containing protein [Streptomyces noursei]|uniref:STAS domain-containing protein n=1 Tax=Streptomyces noursei TaxID=1971 RepID=UPI0023B78E0B|nr:STAS domain-containing protein [Streptomyces noursei]